MAWDRQGVLALVVLGLVVAVGALVGCLDDGPAEPAAVDDLDDSDSRAGSGNASATNGTSTEGSQAPTNDAGDEPAGSEAANVSVAASAPGFTTYGCDTTFAMTEVPRPWAQARTPDGVEPLTFFPVSAFVPGAPNRTVRASFFVASNHCDRVLYEGGSGSVETSEEVDELYYGVFVEPAEPYQVDHVKMYAYPFGWIVDDDAGASRLSEWDLPFQSGSVDLARNAEAGGGRSWTVTAEAGDLSARLDLETMGSASAGDEPTIFRFVGQPRDGGVQQAMDYVLEVSNSTQNPPGGTPAGALFDLGGQDDPAPTPTPSPISITRWTPTDKVAQRATLVELGP